MFLKPFNQSYGYHRDDNTYLRRFKLLSEAPVGELSDKNFLKTYDVPADEQDFCYLYEERIHEFALTDANFLLKNLLKDDPQNPEIENLKLLVDYLKANWPHDCLHTYLKAQDVAVNDVTTAARRLKSIQVETIDVIASFISGNIDKDYSYD